MSVVISVNNVSKVYNLGVIGSGTLVEDISKFWTRLSGKKDLDLHTEDDSIHVALRDISFTVSEGEVLGVIGKNGAGKSTLLKVLSRITSPTTGTVKMKGRVASLLEVGTGFHPELSGRENIFLNGAILGMTRAEVQKKFDEIVDFSGVEKFIDTPVKRYSSGMYVRLAFAVAAHLEPEILIVDEVLAVGDAEFQKKCLGKMKDVSSNHGRTVLFVSHNMTAVKNLCNRAIFLKQGQLVMSGAAEKVVNHYQSNEFVDSLEQQWEYAYAPGNEWAKANSIQIKPVFKFNQNFITPATPINVEYKFWSEKEEEDLNLSMTLHNVSNEPVFNVVSSTAKLKRGLHTGVCHIPGNLLNDGYYSISMLVVKNQELPLFELQNCVSFEVVEDREVNNWHHKWIGHIRPKLDFTLE